MFDSNGNKPDIFFTIVASGYLLVSQGHESLVRTKTVWLDLLFLCSVVLFSMKIKVYFPGPGMLYV